MSLRRLNPPIHLLRAFSTVVRFGGVSRAAEALHLTQSAVSKQIQELEKWVGVPLFERERKRLSLTPAGERYERAVRALLGQLEAATLELITSDDSRGALHLSSLPTFAAKWLIPRLPQFQQRYPQITLHFVPYVHSYQFDSPGLDCAILFGDGHWSGAHAHYLVGRQVALIAPPHGTGPEARITTPQDVARCTRLRHVTIADAWARWSEAHGIHGISPLAGPQFDQFQTIIRAVMAGLVNEPLPQHGYQSALGYWLCYPADRANHGTLGIFRNWLVDHAAQTPGRVAMAPVAPDAPAAAGQAPPMPQA